jgi:hypothetical protein
MMSSRLSYLIAREKDRTIASRAERASRLSSPTAISLRHVPGARAARQGDALALSALKSESVPVFVALVCLDGSSEDTTR